MFMKDGVAHMQENHYHNYPEPALEARTKSKIEYLAHLLHQPKEQLFRILPCVGWKYIQEQSCISFVFEVQPKPTGAPVSLQRLLFGMEHRPELGDKFRLALGLLECIAQLHMVQWVSICMPCEFSELTPVSATREFPE